jgi:hypothetical protein
MRFMHVDYRPSPAGFARIYQTEQESPKRADVFVFKDGEKVRSDREGRVLDSGRIASNTPPRSSLKSLKVLHTKMVNEAAIVRLAAYRKSYRISGDFLTTQPRLSSANPASLFGQCLGMRYG